MIQDNPAWALLNDLEQTGLNLKHVQGKSTWEIGEILGKSHYKYLENIARGEFFFKMFSNHFRIYSTVIPKQCKISRDFRKYLQFVMQDRLSVKEAVESMNNGGWAIGQVRERLILKEMTRLEESESATDNHTFELIKDFDRWNNFRILPYSLQEPSAFKRRNKNRLKKHLRIYKILSPFHFEIIRENLELDADRTDVKVCYVPLPIPGNHFGVMRMNCLPHHVEFLANLCIYVFHKETEANDYCELLENYIESSYKTCKWGLKFWPKYRTLITYAINYAPIQRIIPTRQWLEIGMRDLDRSLVDDEEFKEKYPNKKSF